MPLLVTVFAERDSPRLRYVLDWLLGERLKLQYHLTHDRAEALSASYCLAYGGLADRASIHASSLLWETELQAHNICCVEWQGLYTLYFEENSSCDIQFDMLAGIFYLLTRYEEYLPFEADRHGRFPATKSILFPVLERPVVDEWVEALRIFLEQVWNVSIARSVFAFQPTYDIDIAWKFQHKGPKRLLGAAIRDVAALDWPSLRQRIRVSQGREEDPYFSFVYLLAQHMMNEVRPVYFVLAASKSSAFDKNISPRHPRMAGLIQALAGSSTVGLHPSYYSDEKPHRLKEEKAVLERITDKLVVHSRQHYIRLRFPQTYRSLTDAGIEADWSMGYSTCMGFRAGTGCAFQWFDLERGHVSALRVHPFAFMDSTAHFDLGLSPDVAFSRLRMMAASLRRYGGTLVTVMHNFSLGSDAEWKGWRREYERFLQDVAADADIIAK